MVNFVDEKICCSFINKLGEDNNKGDEFFV